MKRIALCGLHVLVHRKGKETAFHCTHTDHTHKKHALKLVCGVSSSICRWGSVAARRHTQKEKQTRAFFHSSCSPFFAKHNHRFLSFTYYNCKIRVTREYATVLCNNDYFLFLLLRHRSLKCDVQRRRNPCSIFSLLCIYTV